MNLSDRLAAAGRPTGDDGARPEPRRPGAALDAVKIRVHQALIDALGPKLYDPQLSEAELEQRVRVSVQSVLQVEDTPLSVTDRARLAQEIEDGAGSGAQPDWSVVTALADRLTDALAATAAAS